MMDGIGDGGRMSCAFIPPLLVAAVNQNGEINAQADKDGAKADRDHVKLMENEQTDGKRN